jgi:hypothetical protein
VTDYAVCAAAVQERLWQKQVQLQVVVVVVVVV